MKRLQFNIQIKSSPIHAYNVMLGKDTYKQWTAAFNPSSNFEGSWDKGSTILFIGVDEEGKKGGMVAQIRENEPGRFVSIEHLGILDGDKQIIEGPQVEDWAGALENYSFSEGSDFTTLTVEVDTKEEYIDYFEEAWPKALNKLKEICESEG